MERVASASSGQVEHFGSDWRGRALRQAGALGRGGWSGLEIFDLRIFAFGGLGGERGLGESWQIKPHLEKWRFRRDMAIFRSMGGGLWPAGGGQRGGGVDQRLGFWSKAAGTRSGHVGRRWSKSRGFPSQQRPARSPGARGRQHTGLWEAGSGVPSCIGRIVRSDASHAAPPGRPGTYALRSVQHRLSRLRTSTLWSVHSFHASAPAH